MISDKVIRERLFLAKKEELFLIKEYIAHTVIHLTLWQFLTKGGFWRKQYDEACRALSQLEKEEPEQTVSDKLGIVSNET